MSQSSKPRRSFANNPHILVWWSSVQDEVLVDLIQEWQWLWQWEIPHAIAEVTPKTVLDKWKAEDPLADETNWYELLMRFGLARAKSMGWSNAVRQPATKNCLLCGQTFHEKSLQPSVVRRLGVAKLDFCAPCLWDCLNTTKKNMGKRQILRYLRKLAGLAGRIPPQGFGEGPDDLRSFTTKEITALLRLLRRKPSLSRVKAVYGSWLNALIHAGLLVDGTRPTSRGTQTIARDGHVCLSLGEKTIDDFLLANGIPHEKEPSYPKGSYRADFRIGEVLVEYFGLTGHASYDEKTREKMRICKECGIELIAIMPGDLAHQRKLEDKLARVLAVAPMSDQRP
jgi:hypothetical protein